MKSHSIFLFLLFIAFGCTNPKSNQEVLTDSTKQVVDSARIDNIQTESVDYESQSDSDEPFSGITQNFPEYSMATLSDDSVEAEITNRIAELLQIYDTLQFSKITSSYSWERPYFAQGQEGDGFMSSETESETKTWFFDKSNHLRCFSMEMNSESDYQYKKSALYLFSNDSLIACFENSVDASEVEVTDQVRMLASKCPACGTAVRYGDRENPTITYLGNNDLISLQQKFYESMPELISTLKAGRKNATEDDFYFLFKIKQTKEANPDQQAKAITYPISFMVEKDLYPKYISKQE